MLNGVQWLKLVIHWGALGTGLTLLILVFTLLTTRFNITEFIVLHTVYLYVVFKQRLSPYTALTDRLL